MSADPVALGSSGPAALGAPPAWVRDGSAAVRRDYALGLEFERMLAQQMAASLAATAGLGEAGSEEEAAGGAATPGQGVFSTMIAGALADGASAGGGLGLAAEIARDMQPGTGPASARSGGTSA